MILIADSGSTKTDWVFIDPKKNSSILTTKGLNPYFNNSSEIQQVLEESFSNFELNDSVQEVFFYGSGCSSEQMKDVINSRLKLFFKNADIFIESDLLGAARALFLNEKGIAVILGTGASTCLYNGKSIAQSIQSLGFIFGDEGGGDHIGKLFITEYLTNRLSIELSDKFYNRFGLTKDQILKKVYSEPFPNNFLASFCGFIGENNEDKEIDSIIKKSFSLLFSEYICKYPNYKDLKIRVTGSIGSAFSKQLNEIAKLYNTEIDFTLKKPINKLVEYHINNK